MSVFISWSGERSRRLGLALRDWINTVIQRLPVFVSAQDLSAGVQWSETVVAALRDARYGIVCVTSENVNSAWLNFEAGAIANAVGRPRVAPVLLDLVPTDVVGPLSLFQAVLTDRDGILRLVTSINESLEVEALENSVLARAFSLAWPSLDEAIRPLRVKRTSQRIVNKPQRSLEDMIAEVLSILREDRNLRPPIASPLTVPSSTSEFDRILPLLSELRSRAEAAGCDVSTSISESGMDLVINGTIGIRIVGLEGAVYQRLRNHLIQMMNAVRTDRLTGVIIIFTREPGPDIRDLLAATKAQFNVGLAWADFVRIYADRRATELLPWLPDASWEPERKRRS